MHNTQMHSTTNIYRTNVQMDKDCTSGYQQNNSQQYSTFDASKTNLSRRSIDWRDSGIVIDEDNQLLFPSFDALCQFDTRSSIQSTDECSQSAQTATTTTSSYPSQQYITGDEDADGDTILHLAVVGFTCERVRDLMKLCDLNAINNMMQTPLHVAVLANRPEMVQLLVGSGGQLKVHDRRGDTPLHLACQRGLDQIVDIILSAQNGEHTPNSNQQSARVLELIETSNFDGLQCLHVAALNDKRNIIDLLVAKYQANLNARDSKSGETVMHKAIRQFNVDLVSFILNLKNGHQHCNQADYSGREPLSTISGMLQETQLSTHDTSQLERLLKIKVLVERGIADCVAQRGCCLAKQQLIDQRAKLVAGNSLDSSDESSASGSDYSDSDYEMN